MSTENPEFEAFWLYSQNYQRFVNELMPRLDADCSEAELARLYQLASHYQQQFSELLYAGVYGAQEYALASTRLAQTLRYLLGK